MVLAAHKLQYMSDWCVGGGSGVGRSGVSCVFCCCTGSYHKLSGFKQHPCTSSQFCVAGFSALGHTRLKSRSLLGFVLNCSHMRNKTRGDGAGCSP